MEQDPQLADIRQTQRIMKTFAITSSLVSAVASLVLIPAFLELQVCSMRLDVYLVLFLSLLAVYVSVPSYFFFIREPLFEDPPLEWMRIGVMVHVQIGLLAFSVFPEMWMVVKLKSYCRSKVRTGILVLIYIEYGLTALVSVLWLAVLVIFIVLYFIDYRPSILKRKSLRANSVRIWREQNILERWKLIINAQPAYRRWNTAGRFRQAYFLHEELLTRDYLTWECRPGSTDEHDLGAFTCSFCELSFGCNSRVTAIPHKQDNIVTVEYFHADCWIKQSINSYHQARRGQTATFRRGMLSIVNEMFPEMKGDKSKLPRFLIADQDHILPH